MVALEELHRVLKTGARCVLDIPNLAHPHLDMMLSLEESLGRRQYTYDQAMFEDSLAQLFIIDRIDNVQVMVKYFCRLRPGNSEDADTNPQAARDRK